jgi:hypothetical protein
MFRTRSDLADPEQASRVRLVYLKRMSNKVRPGKLI